MYAGIDIGGSKTLVASLDDDGVIQNKVRFETPQDYTKFLATVEETLKQFGDFDFLAAGIGVPGTLDRKYGRIVWGGNLPWKNMPIKDDLEDLLHCPVVIENDAKMAALSESMMVKDEFRRVLYVTVSTGIGFGLVVDRVIDDKFGDAGGANMLVEHKGQLRVWEDFASGKAIVQVFGKLAKDITDENTWKIISRNLSVGLMELIALTQPEVIVFGGSVGHYFDRFGKYLKEELSKYSVPTLTIPELRTAARPDEAVLYGCYDLAKTRFSVHGLVVEPEDGGEEQSASSDPSEDASSEAAPEATPDDPEEDVALGEAAEPEASEEEPVASDEYVDEAAASPEPSEAESEPAKPDEEEPEPEVASEVPGEPPLEPEEVAEAIAVDGLEKLDELGSVAVEAEEADAPESEEAENASDEAGAESDDTEKPVDDLMLPPPDELVGPLDENGELKTDDDGDDKPADEPVDEAGDKPADEPVDEPDEAGDTPEMPESPDEPAGEPETAAVAVTAGGPDDNVDFGADDGETDEPEQQSGQHKDGKA